MKITDMEITISTFIEPSERSASDEAVRSAVAAWLDAKLNEALFTTTAPAPMHAPPCRCRGILHDFSCKQWLAMS